MTSSTLKATALDPVTEFVKRAKPQSWRGLLELFIGGYLRIVLATALFIWQPSIWTFIVAYFVMTSSMGCMIHLSHESQHASLLKNKRLNDLVGAWMCAYPLGSIYGASRAVHLAHHKYLNTPADPDKHFHVEDDKSSPRQFLTYFLRLLAGGQLWTSIVVNGFLRGGKNGACATADGAEIPSVASAQWVSKSVTLPTRQYPEILNLVPVQLAIWAAFWLASGQWWLYFALWIFPIMTLGTLLGYMRGFIDHARLADDDEQRSEGRLISVPNPSLFDKLFLTGMDFEFHAEHHLFPAVPHYYLPRLHKLMQADEQYRQRYLLRESYTSFLGKYWKQICEGRKSRTTEHSVEDTQWPMAKRPKVLFVTPKLSMSFWGMEYSAPYTGKKYPNPPLGIMTLAGAISNDYEVEIRDENVGSVDYNTDADIVGISGQVLHQFHVKRVIALARYFRSLGKVVCIGGAVANLSPELVRDHCDVLFEGEGELTWPQFLRDYEAGNYKDSYQQSEKFDMAEAPVPRIDLINPLHYGAGQIQTTRGCPFTCEFCDIIVVFGRKVRAKPVETVMREVQMWADGGSQIIFFSDDNFVGNRVYCKSLLRSLIEFNKKRQYPVYFYTQASIDSAKDPELLGLMRDANFAGMFIGIESPRMSSLTETHKVQNVHTEDMSEAIHIIQSYGLFVSGGMIVGFDNDDVDIFDEQYEFLQRAGVVFAQMSLLEAMPKTPLYDRIKASGRLLEYYHGLPTNIMPMNMTLDELVAGYSRLIKRVYSYDAYAERYLLTLRNMNGHKFEMDNPLPLLRNLAGLVRTVMYYVCTTDRAKHKFFIKMMKGTMEINPHAWKWTLRYMVNFIHFHKFAHEDLLTTMAPMATKLPAAKAS
jgi:radical SAM superfamily enzyme YgiQ (UPF0313 family)/fatty acid desaturase